jgi:phosphoribosylformylglycinamidine cyclo-ligase
VCFVDNHLTVDQYLEELGCTLGEELLKPTRIYVQSVLNVLKNYRINGMVHNTGGGFIDNTPRVLPKGCKAVINKGTWNIPPIFPLLQRLGDISEEEMYRTFNMGIGLLVVINKDNVSDILHHFKAVGEEAFVIGEIVALDEENEPRVEIRS